MEIVSGIHQVDGVNGNCYIIAHKSLTLIDTGLPDSGEKILAYIRDVMHRDPLEIADIVITHAHWDHTGGLPAIRAAAPKAKISIGEQDACYIDGTRPHPGPKGILGLKIKFRQRHWHPVKIVPDVVLKDGDRIAGLICVTLPGHTPGSIGLLDGTNRAFFCGDILRSDGTAVILGPREFSLDPARELSSLEKLANLEFDLLLPGHGVPLRPGASAKVREYTRTLT